MQGVQQMAKSSSQKARNIDKASVNNLNSDSRLIDLVFIFAIMAFMLVIPFYRGLFFRENYISSIIVIGFIFAAYIVYKLYIKSPVTFNTYMDFAFVCIPLIYLLSFFTAVNAKDAFDQFLIYSAYFMIYKISSSLVQQNNEYKTYFLNGIILSAFILSFTSILDIMGVIDLQVAFIGKRFYGLYQYANTTASVLGVGIVLLIDSIINEKNIKIISIYHIILTSIIASFIFTLSRGAYLVLAAILLFNFLVIDAVKKLKFIISLSISFVSNAYLIYKFYILPETEISQIGKLYIYAIILSGVISLLIYSLNKVLKINFSVKTINLTLMTIVLILSIIIIVLFSIKEPIEYKIEHVIGEENSWKYTSVNIYDLIPEKEYTIEFDVMSSKEAENSYGLLIRSYNETNEYTELIRIFEPVGINFTHKSFTFKTLSDTKWIRFYLYNYESDSYTIYKNVVIRDLDGTYYKKMEKLKYVPEIIANRLQDINLETTNAALRLTFAKDGIKILKDYPLLGAGGGAWKNLYRQYQSIPYNTTEVHNYYVQFGTEVGIVGLLALTALLLIFIYYMLMAIKNKSEFVSIYIAILSLLLHSTIDFNLSLVAVGYLLWMLMGIINGEKRLSITKIKSSKIIIYPILLFSLIIPFMASSIYFGIKTGEEAARLASEKSDINRSIELYKKAIKLDKFNTVYRFDLAQIMNNELRKTKKEEYYRSFMEQVAMIRKYEPYNHRYTPTICSMYMAIGRFEEASALADRYLKDMPMAEAPYAMKIDVNYEIASFYLKDELLEEAMPYLTKILEARDELNDINLKLEKPIELSEEYQNKINGANRVIEMIKEDLNNQS